MKSKPIQYTQLDNGRWRAKKELGSFGSHIAYADTRKGAEQKLRSGLKSHAYSITHGADGYFG